MIKLLSRFRKLDWLFLTILIGFTFGQVYFDLKLPEYTSKIIGQMMDPLSTSKNIWATGGKMILVCLGSIGCTILLGFFATMIATNFSRRTRLEIFKKVESFSLEEMSQFETSSLITRTTNDVQQVQMAYGMTFRLFFSAPITAVWAILKIGKTNLKLSLTVGFTILTLIILILIVFVLVAPHFKKAQKLTDKLNDVTRENLTGLRVVRAYDAEDYQNKKFEKANQELTHNYLVANRLLGILMPAMSVTMSAISLVVYWMGGYLIDQNKIGYADLAAFVSYSMQILFAFLMVAMMLIMIPRASVSAHRILEVLNTKNKLVNPKEPKAISSDTSLEFKNVSFKYPASHKNILSNLSFDVKKGETLAIIGATGSGKTSLVNLVPRFFDATEGEVLVNGNNVKDYNKEDLRRIIGYVPQKKYLFSGDIKTNIKFANPATITDEQMKEAAYISASQEFVESLEETYDSHVAQGGKNFSGGQQQRLSIARAIANKPQIYIFDDSFSALDYKTDKEVRKRLSEATKDSISVIVTQRIGTIIDANKIVVLDKGEIVGYGTHKELLQTCEVYKEIALSQLSKEELGL